MTLVTTWLTGIMAAVLGNHLWQSALFVPVALFLTLALREHRAQIRYVLWLTASFKFLIPFAPFIAFGGWLASGRPALVEPHVMFVMDTVIQPLSWPNSQAALPSLPSTVQPGAHQPIITLLFLVWTGGLTVILVTWGVRWFRVTRTVRQGARLQAGREIDILRRVERVVRVRTATPIIALSTTLEPGVFGIRRPVLLWPRRLGSRLTDAQIAAIFTHELCHLRRRDNLAAAFHMIVEALFWMHPLVWWLGARLVDERERACDEEVIRLGTEPQVYAEGILKTCHFCVEAPLACVAGVTGSDLRARIVRIISNRPAERVAPWTKSLLGMIVLLAFAGPIAVGVLSAPRLMAQAAMDQAISGSSEPRSINSHPSGAAAPAAPVRPRAFDVVSIKSNKSGDFMVVHGMIGPGGRYYAQNATLKGLIRSAYGVHDFQVSGGPGWLDSDRFDIMARPDGRGASREQALQMVRALLAERFELRLRSATHERPIYALTLARKDRQLGPELRPSTVDCAEPPVSGNPLLLRAPDKRCGFGGGRGRISGRGATTDVIAAGLSPLVDRVVVNRTGLHGRFDVELTYAGDFGPMAPSDASATERPPGTGPSIFVAVQEQLGLELNAQRGPVDVLVVEGAERPTPD